MCVQVKVSGQIWVLLFPLGAIHTCCFVEQGVSLRPWVPRIVSKDSSCLHLHVLVFSHIASPLAFLFFFLPFCFLLQIVGIESSLSAVQSITKTPNTNQQWQPGPFLFKHCKSLCSSKTSHQATSRKTQQVCLKQNILSCAC